MKGVCMIRSMIFLKTFFLDINVGFSTQNSLRFMVEKLLLARDKKEVCGAILTNLPKALDCISHDLLIAKLNADQFYQNAVSVIHNYLFGRSQKIKVG